MKLNINIGKPLDATLCSLSLGFVNRIGIDGKSAYEVACDNGFEGTEQEWIESLRGEHGDMGQIEVAIDDLPPDDETLHVRNLLTASKSSGKWRLRFWLGGLVEWIYNNFLSTFYKSHKVMSSSDLSHVKVGTVLTDTLIDVSHLVVGYELPSEWFGDETNRTFSFAGTVYTDAGGNKWRKTMYGYLRAGRILVNLHKNIIQGTGTSSLRTIIDCAVTNRIITSITSRIDALSFDADGVAWGTTTTASVSENIPLSIMQLFKLQMATEGSVKVNAEFLDAQDALHYKGTVYAIAHTANTLPAPSEQGLYALTEESRLAGTVCKYVSDSALVWRLCATPHIVSDREAYHTSYDGRLWQWNCVTARWDSTGAPCKTTWAEIGRVYLGGGCYGRRLTMPLGTAGSHASVASVAGSAVNSITFDYNITVGDMLYSGGFHPNTITECAYDKSTDTLQIICHTDCTGMTAHVYVEYRV
jgi:hypothetical protein